MSRSEGHLSYRADIDGLRAVAVLAVVAHHLGLPLPGGFLGVDVFFVISGYLITSLLLKELEDGRFSILTFWERRARRIFPALFAMLFATTLAAYFILLPADFREFGQSLLAQAMFVSNVYFWREADYFAAGSEAMPLLHTWSLSVEEQFYLAIPFVLLLASRSRSKPFALTLVSMLAVVTLAAYHVTNIDRSAAFFLTPFRATGLLLGCIVAAWRPRWGTAMVRQSASLACAVVLAGCFLLMDGSMRFPGLIVLVPCVATAGLISMGGADGSAVHRFFSAAWVVRVGLLSYSIYLWHWPVIALHDYLSVEERTPGEAVALFALTMLMAATSWRFVEQPVRNRTFLADRRSLFVAAGTAIALASALGSLLHVAEGARWRYSHEVLTLADGERDHFKQRNRYVDVPIERLSRDGFPVIGGASGHSSSVLLVGDSHAESLLPVIADLADEFDVGVTVAIRTATAPLHGAYSGVGHESVKAEFLRRVEREMSDNSEIALVLLAARWHAYGRDKVNRQNMARALAVYGRSCRNISLVMPIPEPEADVPRHAALALHFGAKLDIGALRDEYSALLAQFVSQLPQPLPLNVQLVDVSATFFSQGERSSVVSDGRTLYYDDDHLSAYGSRRLGATLTKAFVQLQRPSDSAEWME